MFSRIFLVTAIAAVSQLTASEAHPSDFVTAVKRTVPTETGLVRSNPFLESVTTALQSAVVADIVKTDEAPRLKSRRDIEDYDNIETDSEEDDEDDEDEDEDEDEELDLDDEDYEDIEDEEDDEKSLDSESDSYSDLEHMLNDWQKGYDAGLDDARNILSNPANYEDEEDMPGYDKGYDDGWEDAKFVVSNGTDDVEATTAYEKGYNDSHEDADSVFSAGFKAARDKNGTLITALAWSTALFGVVSLGYSLFWIHRAVERKIQRKNAIKYGHAEDPKVMV